MLVLNEGICTGYCFTQEVQPPRLSWKNWFINNSQYFLQRIVITAYIIPNRVRNQTNVLYGKFANPTYNSISLMQCRELCRLSQLCLLLLRLNNIFGIIERLYPFRNDTCGEHTKKIDATAYLFLVYQMWSLNHAYNQDKWDRCQKHGTNQSCSSFGKLQTVKPTKSNYMDNLKLLFQKRNSV